MDRFQSLVRGCLALALLFCLCLNTAPLEACTRLVYLGSNGDVITARSMDWADDVMTNLWIFPRAMHRNGEVGSNSFEWTSRYGSVIASGYDISTTDGMNEKGLVVNALWWSRCIQNTAATSRG